jgi:hypothetical protein
MMAESEVRHIRCTANLAAHQIAKMALVHSLDSVWMEICPPFILSTSSHLFVTLISHHIMWCDFLKKNVDDIKNYLKHDI